MHHSSNPSLIPEADLSLGLAIVGVVRRKRCSAGQPLRYTNTEYDVLGLVLQGVSDTRTPRRPAEFAAERQYNTAQGGTRRMWRRTLAVVVARSMAAPLGIPGYATSQRIRKRIEIV
jgi:hypothetical protein